MHAAIDFEIFETAMKELLPAAYVVRGKVLFSQVSVCSHLGGLPTFQVLGGGYLLSGLGGGGGYLLRSEWKGGTYSMSGWGGTYLARS